MVYGDSSVKGYKSCDRCLRPIPMCEDENGYCWIHCCNYVVSTGRVNKDKPKKKKEVNTFIKSIKDKTKERWQRN